MSEEKKEAPISRNQSLLLTLAAIVGAVTTFVFTWWASKVLSVQENTDFLIFWSLISLVFASLIGIQQESTRLVSTYTTERNSATFSTPSSSATVRPPTVAFVAGATVAIIFLLLIPVWTSRVLPPDHAPVAIVIITVAALAYGIHAYFIGATAGLKAWTEYSLLIATGGVFCLILAFIVSIFSTDKIFFELSFALTSLLWIAFLVFSPRVREAAQIRVTTRPSKVYLRMMWAIATSFAVAIMSVGFPALLKLTSRDETTHNAAFLAALILAISITRAPIMLPLQAFQGVAISHFLTQKGSPFRSLIKPSLALLALGVLGGVLGYLVGPWLFDFIYSDYAGQISGTTLGLLTFAAGLLAVTTLSGTAALALDTHPVYLSGWVATVVVSCGLLFLPWSLESRALVALLAGPVVGFIVHVIGMETVAKRRGIEPDETIASAVNTRAEGE